MACPSGCINGGGQIKAPNPSLQVTKEWISKSEKVYQSDRKIQGAEANQKVQKLYNDWLGQDETKISKMLHTTYHAVSNNLQSGLAVKW
jgi:iron only hydrogenase large subunit-like protein